MKVLHRYKKVVVLARGGLELKRYLSYLEPMGVELHKRYKHAKFSQHVLELILLGIVLIFLGMLILMLSLWRAGEGRAEAGGVVIVGPVPIVFGTSQRVATTVMVLAIVLTVVVLLLLLFGLALLR